MYLYVPDLQETKTYEQLLNIKTEHLLLVKSYFSERLLFYTSKRKIN